MKKMNRIFFQILVLVLMMTSAMSNAFAQGGLCIRAYMLEEETCSPGHDGSATVFIPTSLSGKCSIEWRLRDGSTSSSETISGLDHGLYYVTVRSTTCSNVIFYQGTVNVTQEEECAIKVNITGPSEMNGDCNGIPPATFTASASGGVPPYTFGGWSQAGGASATKTVHLGEGHNSITCTVTDSEGNYGTASLDVFAKKEECAQDPNEIKGPAGYSEEQRFVNATDKMNYTIGFENDPEFAMAPASYVKITYDVPDKQKLASFRLADFGFGSFVFTVPSNVSSYSQRLDVSDSLGVWVDVNAGIDIVHNQLFWIFQSIDPATGAEPASSQMGFLPINDSQEHGQGYVSFYIAPANNVTTGDTIGAEAVIVFDDNAPIGTNVWTNTFDAVAPASTLHANMNAADSLYCTFSFEAQDDPNGSGVRDVEVYVSVNNENYFSIGNAHPDSTLSYALENGIYYQFMSIATDNVGNKEAFKAVADTSVNYNTAPIDIVLNGNVFYEYDPANTQIGVLYTMDNDVNLPFVYELVNGDGDDDNAYFVIDGNNLRTDTTFVCGHKTEYSVRVRSTDIGGLYFEKSFTLNEIIQHETPVLRLNKTICQGESVDFYGRELSEAGMYADTLTTELGCDSIIVWYLNVNPSYNNTPIDTIVCDQFVWNDSTYTVSTVINYTYTLSTGCDSTITFNLTVNHSSEGVDELVACDSLTWIDGVTYYESTNIPTFVYPNGNAVGCDSTVTLHLTVNHSSVGDTTAVVCDSFDWYEHVGLVQSGDYVHTFVEGNSEGCDSVVTLHLTVNPPVAMNSVYDQVITHGSWIEGVTFSSNLSEGEMSYAWIRDNEENVTGLPANGTGNIDAVALGNLTNMAQTTTFTVTPTHMLNGISCDGESISFTVTVNPQAVMDGVDNQFVCSGSAIDEVTFTTSLTDGNMTYEWNRDNTENVTGLDANGTGDIDAVVLTNQTDMPQDVTFTVVPTYSNNGISNIGDAIMFTVTVYPNVTGDTSAVVCDSFDWYEQTNLTESSDYTRVFPSQYGCDSTVTLHLTVNYGTHNVYDTIVCESYEWHEHLYTESGIYTYEYTNDSECASVDTLRLTVNYGTHNVYDTTVCESYEWHELLYTESGTYTYEYTNDSECASVDTLRLTVNYGTHNVYDTTVCEGYEWHEHLYTESGTYTYEYTNDSECTSVDTLRLTVNYGTHNVYDTIVCESYEWHEHLYTETGTYTYEYYNAAGCASVDTLRLTVNYSSEGVDEQIVCDSLTWIDEITYYESTNIPTFTIVGGAFNGCDSVVTLHLTVKNTAYGDTSAVACGSFVWHGVEYTETPDVAPTYTMVGGASNDCDSIVTLHLTVNNPAFGDTIVTTCESFTWHEVEYTETPDVAPTYTYENGAANGCDSTVTLHLTINHPTEGIDVREACNSFTWIDGVTYTESTTTPVYTIVEGNAGGCDSTVTLHLTITDTVHVYLNVDTCESYAWYGVTYNESGVYEHYFNTYDGCDSVEVLNLTIHHANYNSEIVTVCNSYEWYGEIYTESGTYIHHYANTFGCASVDTLYLTVNYATHNVVDTAVCEGFEWHEQLYTESGTYTFEYTNANDCPSADTLHLTVNHGTYNVFDTIVCESYEWHEQLYTESGTYIYEYTNTTDCASADTLHLTVNQPAIGIDEQEACDSLTWLDEITYYESTNTPTFTIIGGAANGCDSIVTLHLTVNHVTTGVDVRQACNSYTWIDGVTYTESTDDTNAPTFILPNVAGCDSIVTLHLTITDTVHVYFNVDTCESYVWYGDTYNQSGVYERYFTTYGGCDSVEVLILTINHATTGIDMQEACESYTWINGVTYTESTIGTTAPTFILSNVAGCDSIVTLQLTINHGTHNVETEIACESYTWHGQDYTASGTYTYSYANTNGCPSADTLYLTINHGVTGIDEQTACDSYAWIDGTVYTESTNTPTYTYAGAAANGCDSTVTLHLTINESTTVEYYLTINESDLPYTYGDTTFEPGTVQSGDYTFYLTTVDGCDSIIVLHLTVLTGIEDHYANAVMNVYPNPANDKVNVQFTLYNEQLGDAEIQLYDMYGKWLKTWKVTGETTEIDLSPYAASVYFIKVVDGQRMIGVRKVVKE